MWSKGIFGSRYRYGGCPKKYIPWSKTKFAILKLHDDSSPSLLALSWSVYSWFSLQSPHSLCPSFSSTPSNLLVTLLCGNGSCDIGDTIVAIIQTPLLSTNHFRVSGSSALRREQATKRDGTLPSVETSCPSHTGPPPPLSAVPLLVTLPTEPLLWAKPSPAASHTDLLL